MSENEEEKKEKEDQEAAAKNMESIAKAISRIFELLKEIFNILSEGDKSKPELIRQQVQQNQNQLQADFDTLEKQKSSLSPAKQQEINSLRTAFDVVRGTSDAFSLDQAQGTIKDWLDRDEHARKLALADERGRNPEAHKAELAMMGYTVEEVKGLRDDHLRRTGQAGPSTSPTPNELRAEKDAERQVISAQQKEARAAARARGEHRPPSAENIGEQIPSLKNPPIPEITTPKKTPAPAPEPTEPKRDTTPTPGSRRQ